MAGPLDGVLVVDLTRALAGPQFVVTEVVVGQWGWA